MIKKINCLLLVDDDYINNYINERLVKKLDLVANIKIANNGLEALTYVGEFCSLEGVKCCPDLILLDINMPVMNGIEFLKEYNEMEIDKTNTRIVVLTSSENQGDIDKVKELGFFEYLNKPLTEEKVCTLLRIDAQV